MRFARAKPPLPARASSPTTYQQPRPSLCARCAILISINRMNADRIETALQRIEAAMARIDAARDSAAAASSAKAANGSARVIGLVNAHEKLREQVAESLRELDDLLAKLEDDQA